jgi:hypothetical protein
MALSSSLSPIKITVIGSRPHQRLEAGITTRFQHIQLMELCFKGNPVKIVQL